MKCKSTPVYLCAILMLSGSVYADSFLTAQSFPKTFNDVPFIDRMEILADGYDDFDPEYDENGRCISGCAYKGMKLEDELAAITRNTEAARQQLAQYRLNHPEEFVLPEPQEQIIPPVTQPETPPVEPITQPVQPITPPVTPVVETPETPVVETPENPQQTPPHVTHPQPAPPSATYQCAQHSKNIRPGLNAVIQAPLDGALVITSDFGTRKRPCARCSSQHRGIDLSATIGTNVYTPANGRVVSITSASSNCGIGVVIEHPNGYRTSYCHLSRALVNVGDNVQGGCLIGKSGNTGASTGPHLHYAIKYNGTWIDPLYTENRLSREYRFGPKAQLSKEHSGKVLPGKIN